MKGVILAGGHGTRLHPLTHYCNKHLLPIWLEDQAVPIIEIAVRQLKDLGCKDVAVVLGDFRAEDIITFFHKYIKPKYDMNFTYYFQGEPLGIAHAVAQAKDFVIDENGFWVILGDNCFVGKTIIPSTIWHSCEIYFAETKEPERYGSPIFEKSRESRTGRLVKIVEKPKKPETNLALTGLYRFDSKFYFDAYSTLEKSARGEYELTDIINIALKDNEYFTSLVQWTIYEGFWIDAGTFKGIYKLSQKLNEVIF